MQPVPAGTGGADPFGVQRHPDARGKAKAGEQISLFDVAEAAKAEAQKPKQPQRPAQKQKKPSIRAQLKAAKEEQQKKPPQREKAQELEV